MFWQAADGSGNAEPLATSEYRQGPSSWSPDGQLLAVDVITQPTFSAGKARLLFEGQYRSTNLSLPRYDVTPDGQLFLLAKQNERATSAPQINVVLNWFEELKRRAPPKK